MNTNNLNAQDFFNLIKSSDFDERQLLEIVDIVKKDNLFQSALDNNKIWQAKGENDKRWKFKTKEGKIVARKEKEKIKEAYLKYLEESGNEETDKQAIVDKGPDMTFKVLFQKWLDYKKAYVGTAPGQLSPTTYRRYLRDYDKFIKGTVFEEQKIGEITPITIENFLKSMVEAHKPGKQCFRNVAGYISSSWKYACKNGDIKKNPYDLVDTSPISRLCENTASEGSERTLTTEEQKMLLDSLHKAQADKELYMPNYAVELALLTGMRVGELAALKWECISDEGIQIKYAERRFDLEDGSILIDIGDTKNGKHRVFPMTDEIKELLERIKAVQTANGIDSEFVFAGTQGRFTEHAISQASYRRCKDAGLPPKSIHSIRRTVSSSLRAVLPAATVAAMMGHTEETSDKFYNYDVMTMVCKKEAIDDYQSSLYCRNAATA